MKLAELGDIANAVIHHRDDLRINRRLKDTLGQIIAHRNLGATLSKAQEDRRELALRHLNEALTLSESTGNLAERQRCLVELGNFHLLRSEYARASDIIDFRDSNVFRSISNTQRALFIRRAFGFHYQSLLAAQDLGREPHFSSVSKPDSEKMIQDAYLNLGLCYDMVDCDLQPNSSDTRTTPPDSSASAPRFTGPFVVSDCLPSFPVAVSYLRYSLQMAKRRRDYTGKYRAYSELGVAYLRRHMARTARTERRLRAQVLCSLGSRMSELAPALGLSPSHSSSSTSYDWSALALEADAKVDYSLLSAYVSAHAREVKEVSESQEEAYEQQRDHDTGVAFLEKHVAAAKHVSSAEEYEALLRFGEYCYLTRDYTSALNYFSQARRMARVLARDFNHGQEEGYVRSEESKKNVELSKDAIRRREKIDELCAELCRKEEANDTEAMKQTLTALMELEEEARDRPLELATHSLQLLCLCLSGPSSSEDESGVLCELSHSLQQLGEYEAAFVLVQRCLQRAVAGQSREERMRLLRLLGAAYLATADD